MSQVHTKVVGVSFCNEYDNGMVVVKESRLVI